MNVHHAELLETPGTVKFLLNEHAILFFSTAMQHRDVKAHGLSYEDDYRGNALAGLVVGQAVEIRFHASFPDERVRNLWLKVRSAPQLASAGFGRVKYQSRTIL